MSEGEIPQSSALAEALPQSLDELFSRDPEGYSEKDLDRIIGALRDQRERWSKTEAEGKQIKVARSARSGPKAPISADSLGLMRSSIA